MWSNSLYHHYQVWRRHGLNLLRVPGGGPWTRAGHRLRHKKGKGTGQKKLPPTGNALNYFDIQYSTIYGDRWPSIRLALLSQQKYGAIPNIYADLEETSSKLSALGANDILVPSEKVLKKFLKVGNREMDKEDGLAEITKKVHENRRRKLEDAALLKDKTSQTEEDFSDEPFENNQQESFNVFEKKYIEIKPYSILPHDFMDKIRTIEDEDCEGFLDFTTGSGDRDPSAFYTDDGEFCNIGPTTPALSFRKSNLETLKSLTEMGAFFKCFSFRPGSLVQCPPSNQHPVSKLLNYVTLDVSAVLSVLALDIQPGDRVLDMCAGTGEKAIALLQQQQLGGLVVNEPDVSERRILEQTLRSYIPESYLHSDTLRVSDIDGEKWGTIEPNKFDKVLLDPPCASDRKSATCVVDNLFQKSKMKDRFLLPQLQAELLCSALISVKPGGCVVYTTCTLSPTENTGVINQALDHCSRNLNLDIVTEDLTPLSEIFQHVFSFHKNTQSGILVLPKLSSNFGPTFIAKLHKL